MQSRSSSVRDDNGDLAEVMDVLTEKIDLYTRDKGNEPTSSYPPLTIYRFEAPTEQTSYTQEPAVCLIVQGHKRSYCLEMRSIFTISGVS